MQALKLILSAAALCGYAQFASADADYSINIGRINGQLTCAFSKLNGGSFDCTTHVKGQKQMAVAMTAHKDKAGNVVGFCGQDRFTDNGLNYTLAVGTDAGKALHGVTLITDNMDGTTNPFTANVAASETAMLKAANISPIAVTFPDANSVNVTLSFVMYGAATDSLVSGNDIDGLTNALVEKVRPYLMSLK